MPATRPANCCIVDSIPAFKMLSAVLLCLFASTMASLLADPSQAQRDGYIGQLDQAKLRISQLELTLEHIAEDVDSSDQRLKHSETRIVEMERKLEDLQASVKKLKDELSAGDSKIAALEEEIRLLWAMLRKNNFDIHVLKSKAQESEEKLDVLTSHAEKIIDVVSERWIQIQQFEQALQLVEMRLKAERVARYSRCQFFKFMDDLRGTYIPIALRSGKRLLFDEASNFRSYISFTLEQLKRFYSTVKEFHFELQSLIKQIMEDYEVTAPMAHSEVVFFVASALIVFPVLSGWLLLSSHL